MALLGRMHHFLMVNSEHPFLLSFVVYSPAQPRFKGRDVACWPTVRQVDFRNSLAG